MGQQDETTVYAGGQANVLRVGRTGRFAPPRTLELRLVSGGRGVPGVTLEITTELDPTPRRVVTDADGRVRVEARGERFSVACPLEDGAGATPGTTYADAPVTWPAPVEAPRGTLARYVQLLRFVELAHPDWDFDRVLAAMRGHAGYEKPEWQAMLGLPLNAAPDVLRPVRARFDDAAGDARWLVRVTSHRVRTGESLEGVAQQYGTTWDRLARFNWATSDRDVADLCLGALVGCTRTDLGHYVFTDADAPGVLLVPQRWEATLPAGAHEVAVHPCLTGLRSLLSAQDIVHLRRLGAHEHEGGVEVGVATDRTGRVVATGHVITGIAAGRRRLRELDMPAAMGHEVVSALGAGETMDNLYAATLAGDLGQAAIAKEEGEQATWIGPDTEATHPELTGDVDGFLLGGRLADWLRREGRSFSGLRLSEVLERYFGADRARAWPGHVGNRFATYQGALGPAAAAGRRAAEEARLLDQTRRFAVNFAYGRSKWDGLFDSYDEECASAVDAFLAWVRAQRDPP